MDTEQKRHRILDFMHQELSFMKSEKDIYWGKIVFLNPPKVLLNKPIPMKDTPFIAQNAWVVLADKYCSPSELIFHLQDVWFPIEECREIIAGEKVKIFLYARRHDVTMWPNRDIISRQLFTGTICQISWQGFSGRPFNISEIVISSSNWKSTSLKKGGKLPKCITTIMQVLKSDSIEFI